MSITKSKGRKLAEFLRNITVDSKLTTEGVEDGKIITTGGDLDTRSEDATSLVSAASVTSYVGTKLGDYVHGTHDIDLTFTGDVTGHGTIADMGHTSFNLTLDAETLPVQTGYTGKFLTTDGTSASWATVDTSNGDTAFGWGNHASAGYFVNSGSWLGTHTDKTRVYGISSGGGEVWFGYAGGKGNVIADGEFYANEGQYVLWNAGNDGSGSGLDADLLDGQHGSYFYSPSNVGPSNSVSITGYGNGNFTYYQDSGTFNIHSGWNGYLISNHGDGSNYYRQVIGLPFWGSPTHSRLEGGTQRGIYNMWTAENDGSGSGLDADLLDGQQGSYYTSTYTAAHVGLDTSGSTSYPRMFARNNPASSSDWLRMPTTGGGLLPYSNNNSYVGTSSWKFSQGWFNSLNGGTAWTSANDGSGTGLDADTVDGIQGSSFLRSDEDDYLTSAIIVPSVNRNQGIFGTYDSYKTQHIWSMGTAYRNDVNGSSFGNLYGAAYTFSNRVYTAKGTMGDGHQMVWCQNGIPTAAMGNHLWTSGNTYAAGFIYNSDKAFKENIEPLENSLDTILKLEGVKYTLKESGKSSIGFIAQDVEKVIPEFVEGDEGFKGVNYGQMVAVLTEAMKEQQKQIQDLRAEIEVLKNESK